MYWKYHCSCCYCFRFLIYCLFFRCSSSQKQWPSLLFLVISRFNVWKGNQRQIVEVELICSLNSYSNTHFLIVSRSSTLFLQFFKNFLSFSLSPSSFTRSILRSLFVFHFPILTSPRHFHFSSRVPSHRLLYSFSPFPLHLIISIILLVFPLTISTSPHHFHHSPSVPSHHSKLSSLFPSHFFLIIIVLIWKLIWK